MDHEFPFGCVWNAVLHNSDVTIVCLFRFSEWLAFVFPVICDSNGDRFHFVDFEIVAVTRHICMMCIPSINEVLWP